MASVVSYLPIAFLICVMTFLYVVFMLTFIPKLLLNLHTATLTWVIVVNVFFAITLVCFLLVVNTDPGQVPNCEPWSPYGTKTQAKSLKQEGPEENPVELLLNSVERKQDGRPRFCRICGKYKPDRAHHSRKVGRCILEMDHYCPWVHNCIGYFNKKFFILFIMYATITLILYCVAGGPLFVLACKHTDEPLDFLLVFAWIFAAMLGSVLFAFFNFHLWLMTNAYTTIEYCEKRLAPKEARGTGNMSVKSMYATSPYDLAFVFD